ncbi:hypothetical protein CDIK_1931 [Cucumispora dikerogammari]|nr:hypothetical protein CDIK_1931 [Cucumispora dikerogammari]
MFKIFLMSLLKFKQIISTPHTRHNVSKNPLVFITDFLNNSNHADDYVSFEDCLKGQKPLGLMCLFCVDTSSIKVEESEENIAWNNINLKKFTKKITYFDTSYPTHEPTRKTIKTNGHIGDHFQISFHLSLRRSKRGRFFTPHGFLVLESLKNKKIKNTEELEEKILKLRKFFGVKTDEESIKYAFSFEILFEIYVPSRKTHYQVEKESNMFRFCFDDCDSPIKIELADENWYHK